MRVALADGSELERRFTDLSVPRRAAISASKSDPFLPDLVRRRRRGADVERQVHSRAVLWHCRDRIIRHDRRTIVF